MIIIQFVQSSSAVLLAVYGCRLIFIEKRPQEIVLRAFGFFWGLCAGCAAVRQPAAVCCRPCVGQSRRGCGAIRRGGFRRTGRRCRRSFAARAGAWRAGWGGRGRRSTAAGIRCGRRGRRAAAGGRIAARSGRTAGDFRADGGGSLTAGRRIAAAGISVPGPYRYTEACAR